MQIPTICLRFKRALRKTLRVRTVTVPSAIFVNECVSGTPKNQAFENMVRINVRSFFLIWEEIKEIPQRAIGAYIIYAFHSLN
jgi:hypothetical protein